ncbi:MAG: hypothetical protein A3A86_00585 [Elusimicrobia bacterium RIFCSPLOWO2_01_FULL_60_11]|nr:MAG: hypothetical protein A3A86_00585 [Elusimicrobia bacterium RIFCSPLOWO2_01_FULL_60_11]
MDLADMMRPEVRDFEPYLPGKPIDEVRRELGLKKVVKLASNENALGTSPKAKKALAASAGESFRYPEGPGTLLRRALAKKLGVSDKEVILGAGSDEIIEVLAKAFFNREDEIIVSKHAFIRYKMAADLMGARTLEIPMRNDKHDLQAMAARIGAKTKAIFIANPNNPTGTYNTRSEVADFIDAYRASASPSRPPFNVSSAAQAAARAALEDPAHVRKSAAVAAKGMKYLTGELDELNIPYLRSIGNFILIDVSPKKGKDVFAGLLKKGVVVRAMDEYGFPERVRVSVGLPQENAFFIKCLKELNP